MMIIRQTRLLLNSLITLPSVLPKIVHNPTLPIGIRTATKRAGGFKAGSSDSAGKRRGVKVGGGTISSQPSSNKQVNGFVQETSYYDKKALNGTRVHIGRDFTILASEPGWVQFYTDPTDKTKGVRKYVGVVLRRDQKLPSNPALPRIRRLGLREVDPSEFKKEKKLYY